MQADSNQTILNTLFVIVLFCTFLSPHLFSKKLKVNTYKTIKLPVVLYGLTLREEHSLGIFENKVLGKISGAKSNEITGNEKVT